MFCGRQGINYTKHHGDYIMPYVGQTITEVFPTSISVDSATIKGDTTIGNASEADKKILFDGNAVDYHIGLDDSADSLIIGKGSALGTTTSMAIDANGIITKPLQPAFLANGLASEMTDLSADGSDHNIVFNGERFDQNSDYNTSTGEFTAPVTGKYQFNFIIYTNHVDTGATYYQIKLTTSNFTYIQILEPKFSSDVLYFTWDSPNLLVDMDASDTAKVQVRQVGGTSQLHVSNNANYTVFSGYLVC